MSRPSLTTRAPSDAGSVGPAPVPTAKAPGEQSNPTAKTGPTTLLPLPFAAKGGQRWPVLFVGLNVLLLLAWLWSRGGYTTHIVVRVAGDHYQALVDDRQVLDETVPGPTSGGTMVQLAGISALPSAAGPPGIESITITDARLGSALSANAEPWTEQRTHDSALTLATGPRDATDYGLDLVVQNPTSVDIFLRYSDDNTNAHLSFRPWRLLDSQLVTQVNGAETARRSGAALRLAPIQTMRALLATALRPYPWILAATAGVLLLVRLLRRTSFTLPAHGLPAFWPRLTLPSAIALTVTTTAGLAFANTRFLERIPHVPDSMIYSFQAKVFASGLIAAPAPPIPEVFQTWEYLFPYDGRWVSQYPFGHPLVLALGELVGMQWMVPPIVGGLCLLLVFCLGRQLYGAGVGLLAATLLATSPFFQMSAVNFMSHNTAAFYLLGGLLGIVFLIRARRRGMRILAGATAGLLLGLLFNTRPLTAVAVGLVLGVGVGLRLSPRGLLRPEVLALAATAALLLVAHLMYNAVLMGDPLRDPYSVSGTLSATNLGFSGNNSIERALSNTYTSLTLLDVVLFEAPPGVALLPLLLPFALGTRHRWDYLLAGLCGGIVLAWFVYVDPYIAYGPRFWYEMTPLLALLAARGISMAFTRAAQATRWMRSSAVSLQVLRALGGLAVAGLILLGVVAWWGPKTGGAYYDLVPLNVRDLRGFAYVDARLLHAVQAMDVHHAVVLVTGDCGQCYGSVFPQNDPVLQGDVIYARDRGPAVLMALRSTYPDRRFYRVTYEAGRLEEIPSTQPVACQACAVS